MRYRNFCDGLGADDKLSWSFAIVRIVADGFVGSVNPACESHPVWAKIATPVDGFVGSVNPACELTY